MVLQSIKCTHFKNYAALRLNFSDQLNVLVGPNGSGKTNLLDAIHYLALTRSAFNLIDHQNIQHGQDFFTLQGHFLKAGRAYDLQCSVQKKTKKIFKNNGKPYEKLSAHIGLFPMVSIMPDDRDLIREGSEVRRKFFDSILCQLDTAYLQTLMQYHHILKQRNRLLKLYGEKGMLDRDLLRTYDEQLLPLGQKIFKARQQWVALFYASFCQYHQYIVSIKEPVHVTYQSVLAAPDFEQRFLNNIAQDMLWQRTMLGVHRDDFVFTLQDCPLKKIGSQGQQHSFIIALKLAQFDCIYQAIGVKPLLLLDDIFEKLDEKRIQRLLHLIDQQKLGQVFMTDARQQNIEKIKNSVSLQQRIITIHHGAVVN